MNGNSLWAAFWGLVGGVSLLLGAGLGLTVGAGQKVTASVMAVGAGVLISRQGGKHRKRSQGQQSGGTGVALAVGALGFLIAFVLSKLE